MSQAHMIWDASIAVTNLIFAWWIRRVSLKTGYSEAKADWYKVGFLEAVLLCLQLTKEGGDLHARMRQLLSQIDERSQEGTGAP